MKDKRNAFHHTPKGLLLLGLWIIIWCLGEAEVISAQTSSAADMAVFQGVTVSPNGMAWTTDYLDRSNQHLPKGYTVETGITSRLPGLKTGQHYYKTPVTGSVNIGKWLVAWPNAQCIHYYEEMEYMGYHANGGCCGSYYNNGWFAICADCDEPVAQMHIYAKSSTVQEITSMPARSVYMYLCPYCHGLEMGYEYQHVCKEISANHYTVSYEKNAPIGYVVTGYMPDTKHMYDNASQYEGQDADALGYGDTRLRTNSYSCVGYVFEGWNTKADGTGMYFADGAEIINLTDIEGENVPLYAQWRKAESMLVIDANGGTYQGYELYSVRQAYQTTYQLQIDCLLPARGYLVQFETNGGSSVEHVQTHKEFFHWEAEEGLKGSLEEDVYTFGKTDEGIDTIKAQYTDVSFVLPESVQDNMSLVGWYTTPDLAEDSFIGKPGEAVVVHTDTVLYAKWAALTLWSYEDYESYDGVGAVDLTWEQKDGKSKYYKVAQSRNGTEWKEIHRADSIGVTTTVSAGFTCKEQGGTFTVKDTGYYTLTAYGAKGADYDDILTGGNGGYVSAEYWLQKGDIIHFYAGTAGRGVFGGDNGGSGGGGDSVAETGRGGGAATAVWLTRDGTETLLLVAGGGGGANEKASGGAGGSLMTDVGDMEGKSSLYGGGGGGAIGGIGGAYEAHYHEENADTGGGCYVSRTGTKVCGTAYEAVNAYWECSCGETWGTGSDGYFAPLHADCGEIYWMDAIYRCSGCQKQLDREETHRINYTYYVLGCIYKDEPDGYVIHAEPAQGGSNYIALSFGCRNQVSSPGKNAGDGLGEIVSVDIGYREETILDDVMARDWEAPDPILSYELTIADEQQIRITFVEPQDRGTLYYHRVASYGTDGQMEVIATSNITENTLTTGVAGYYYYTDHSAEGKADASHSRLEENGLLVTVTDDGMYLHIAAVDKAGNIGETAHIALGLEGLPTDETYPEHNGIYTEQLSLENSEFVYLAEEKTYYIKADGITKHTLVAEAFIEGSARQDYQPDSLVLHMEDTRGCEWIQTIVPKMDITKSSQVFLNDSLQFALSREEASIIVPSGTWAERREHGKVLKMEQYFTVRGDQEAFYMYPEGVASLRGQLYYSEQSRDVENGIVIIPDGIAPTMEGLAELQKFDVLDMTEKTKKFYLKAFDRESGLRDFLVIVSNKDNFLEGEFWADDSGSITVEVDKESPLFLGEIEISAMAVDRVGNVNQVGENGIAFTLEAKVFRERNPEENIFKTGDGAILSITTTGYADRVEVAFPEELLGLDPDLNRIYEYEYPYLEKSETIQFHIPLGIVQQEYEITVTAWKNGQVLVSRPALLVVEGNVLDELRTRIRNNS